MTPQERQLVAELFERLETLERNPRDPEAERLIEQGLGRSPHAPYALVQTVLLQDEALKQAHARIEELETALGQGQQGQPGQGGLLDNMRDALFGRREEPRGSVPSVGRRHDAPMGVPAGYREHDPWGRSQAGGAGYAQGQGPYGQGQSPYGAGQYGGPYQNEPMGQPGRFGQGGSFLGTAAAVAAGAIGGSLLLNSFRGMFGGNQHGAFDQASAGGLGGGRPWDSDGGNGDLARQAGLGDIGRSDVAAARSYDSDLGGGAFNAMQGDPGSDDLDLDDGFDIGGDGGEP